MNWAKRRKYIFASTGGLVLSKGLLAVAFLVIPSLAGAGLTRGPYLQPTADLRESVLVAFRTETSTTGRINYGINTLDQYVVTASSTRHHVTLTGLLPGMEYQYQVVADGETSPVYKFKTSPPDGSFRLLVGSDWHFLGDDDDPENPHAAVFDPVYLQMLAFDPDVLFITGDFMDYGDQMDQYQDLFTECRELFATAILAPTPGNHEWKFDAGLAVYRDQYYLPMNGPPDRKEMVYSFDYGGVHFVAIDSSAYGIPTTEWLDNNLSAAATRNPNFIITGRHFPTYLDTQHDRALLLDKKKRLTTVYDNHGVDIEFVGHRHMHQRTFPILNNPFGSKQWGMIQTAEKEHYGNEIKGTIYHQSRSVWYSKKEGYPDLHFASPGEDKYLGYIEVTFQGKRAVVKSLRFPYRDSPPCEAPCPPWVVEDQYEIDKTDLSIPETPVVSNVQVTEVAAHRAVIEWETTNVPSRGQLEFGTVSSSYPFVDARADTNQVFSNWHRAVLQGLEPGTQYYFRAKGWQADEEGVSSEGTFTTPSLAQEGELVAEYDFGGNMFPSDGARVSDMVYEESVRQGWVYPVYPYYVDHFAVDFPADATDTYIYRWNRHPPATWKTELPNGTYDVEITVGNSKYHFGDTRIVLEPGQSGFEVEISTPQPADPENTILTFQRQITITDGMLDMEVGWGNADYVKNTVVNRVRIWTAGHFTGDVTPPTVPQNLAAAAQSETAIQLTWDPSTDPESGIQEYRIYRNGIMVGASNQTLYEDRNLEAETSYEYRVAAVNGVGISSVRSNPVTGTTGADETPPAIGSVSASGNPDQVVVVFSEAVEELSASLAANYQIDPGIAVQSAELQVDLRTVLLWTADLSEGTTYTLTVNNVKDRAAVPNTILPDSQIQFQFVEGNLRPVAENLSITMLMDSVFQGSVIGEDPEGEAVTYFLVSYPDNGHVTLQPETGGITYQPNPGFTGEDWFAFKVNDGSLDSFPALVTILVKPLPEQPVSPKFKNVFNPLNETVLIRYESGKGRPEVTVYTRRGQEIQELSRFASDGDGPYVVWDGKNADGSIVSSGVYIVLIRFDDEVVKKKVVVLK